MRIVLVFTLLIISKFSISQHRCVDNQGNSYKTIKIGNQVWMAENLRVTTYNDGTPIERQYGTDVGFGYENRTGKYVYLNNDGIEVYLYDWYSVDNNKGLAPEGYHIPTPQDWEILINYLGENNGSKIKSTNYGKIEYKTMWPEDCDNCSNWNHGYRQFHFCNACDNKGYIPRSEPALLASVSTGTNSSGFNVKRLPILICDPFNRKGDEVYYNYKPSWWCINQTNKIHEGDGQKRNAFVFTLLFHETMITSAENKKSFLQIRCVKNDNDYSSTSNTNSSITNNSIENKPVDTSFDRFTEFKQLFPCLVSADLTFNYYQSPFYYFEKKSESGKTIEWRITKDGGLWDFNTDQSKWFWNSSITCD